MTIVAAEAAADAKVRFQSAVAGITSRYPSREHALATPPAGSGLKPVMGNYGFPLLGHVMSSLVEPLEFARERYARYGPVSWAGGVGFRVVLLLGPEALETVWINKDKAFSSTKGWAPVIGPFFHRGIMLLDFEEHRDHRRIMQQAFTRSALNGYLDLMRPGIARTVTGWPAAHGFPFYTSVKHLLLDQAAEVFIGAELGPEADALSADFHDTVCGGQAMIRADVPGGVWSRGLRARRRLERYFADQLPARRNGDGNDLFSMLCRSRSDEGERFSDTDIVNHMIFLLMAAHDTSAIAISMLVYELGRNIRWQNTLRDEALAGQRDELTMEDLDTAYPLLDAAFKETLRMYARRDAVPADSHRHRGRRALHPPQDTSGHRRVRLHAAGRLVARTRPVRPGPLPHRHLRRCGVRGHPSLCVRSLRRRGTQVHRPTVRQHERQGDHAPTAPAFPMACA